MCVMPSVWPSSTPTGLELRLGRLRSPCRAGAALASTVRLSHSLMSVSSEPVAMRLGVSSRYSTAFTSSSWPRSHATAAHAPTSYTSAASTLVPATISLPSPLQRMDHTPKLSERCGSRSSASCTSVTLATLSTTPSQLLPRVTACTVGEMVPYSSSRWSGERHVSVMVHRMPRARTSLRSAQSRPTSYTRTRWSWYAVTKNAPSPRENWPMYARLSMSSTVRPGRVGSARQCRCARSDRENPGTSPSPQSRLASSLARLGSTNPLGLGCSSSSSSSCSCFPFPLLAPLALLLAPLLLSLLRLELAPSSPSAPACCCCSCARRDRVLSAGGEADSSDPSRLLLRSGGVVLTGPAGSPAWLLLPACLLAPPAAPASLLVPAASACAEPCGAEGPGKKGPLCTRALVDGSVPESRPGASQRRRLLTPDVAKLRW
mmetsp:Transcript_2964/g.7265  ORF Transcript_2964/g.7265 Transcript_2964/m.7265 type:complete len:432 (-) Transcript_2964:598-1893(-)